MNGGNGDVRCIHGSFGGYCGGRQERFREALGLGGRGKRRDTLEGGKPPSGRVGVPTGNLRKHGVGDEKLES
jgi:hypothetical protein